MSLYVRQRPWDFDEEVGGTGGSSAGGADGAKKETTEETGDGTEADSFERMEVDAPEPEGMGVVSATDGIAVGDEPRLTAYVTVGNRDGVRVGRYLVVRTPTTRCSLTRVVELRYTQQFETDDANEIQARRAMKQGSVEEADYKFLAELEPVAVVSGDERRMPDRLPKPNARVERATDKREMKTGLDIPSEGVFVGHLAVGGRKVRTSASPPTIDYRLRDNYGGCGASHLQTPARRRWHGKR